MNWKLLFLLSLISIAMACAEVFGVLGTFDNILWPLILIFDAVMIAKNTRQKLFLHGFMVCIFNCIWITAIHGALFSTYAANNPEMTNNFKNISANQQMLVFIFGPIIGVFTGLITGVITHLLGKFIKPPAAETV